MQRRTLLRRSGTVLGAAVALGLAGCSGDGGGGDGDGGGTGNGDGTGTTEEDTDTGTTTAGDDETTTQDETTPETTAETTTPGDDRDLGDPAGEVTESSVDGLTIVGLESKVAEEYPFPRQGEWGVKVDVENTGDQSTELNEYTWKLIVYDDAGDVLKRIERANGNIIISPAGGRTLGAGETTAVAIQPTEAVDAEKVGHYEVSLTCGTFADGVYC